jgi:anti-sigma-K factor RskA
VAPPLTHEALADLLGVHAVDALDPDEAALVDAHVATCPRCRGELVELREAASMLAFSGAPAPDGAWERIAAALDPAPPFAVLPVHRRRRRWLDRSTAALLAAAAVVVAILGVQVVRQDQRIDGLTSTPAAQAPTVHLVSTAADASHAADAVLASDRRAYLVPLRLPPLVGGRSYQLWGVYPDGTRSLGVLGPDPSVVAFEPDADLLALSITVERASGASAPSGAPLLHAVVERT